ncbi:MAG: right-handed parallel beta-helix repeat-containing protein, partial [Armatimonadota bacterium]
DHMLLAGGRITLNLKWHNNFKLESCRISGAKQYGIYTEGWSSRFLNSVIRWCDEAGFYGYAHFNNAVIRDCYFGRCKIGALIHGGHGSRIDGCGFERCAQDAVYLRSVKGFSISDSYFELNGRLDSPHFEAESPANAVEIGFNSWGVNIHDCIFRSQKDPNGALIAISDIETGHIYDNLFWTNNPVQNGILLLEKSRQRPDWDNQISNLVVEGNKGRNIRSLLTEEVDGLVEKAQQNGSSFQWEIGEEAPE